MIVHGRTGCRKLVTTITAITQASIAEITTTIILITMIITITMTNKNASKQTKTKA